MRSALALAAMIAAACLTTSCSSATEPSPLEQIAGAYELKTINGNLLPATVEARWVIELTLTLTNEGRLIQRGFDFPKSGVPGGAAPPPTFKQEVDVGGGFTIVNNTVSFHPSSSRAYLDLGTAPFTATDTLVVTANAGSVLDPIWYTYVYVRD